MRGRLLHPALGIVLGAALIAWPAGAAQQGGQTAPGQQPTQTDQGQPKTTPDQSQTSQQTPPDQQQATPSQNDKIKKGSKDDVEAIGNRGVGKGLNIYSLEKRSPSASSWRRTWKNRASWWMTRS